MTSLGQMKMVAQALWAEGRLAELELRNQDAMRAYLDIVKFSHEATRGGPLIDALVKVACESYGIDRLQTLRTNLDASQCREAIRTLEGIEKTQETIAELFNNEKEWLRGFPYHQRVVASLAKIFSKSSIKKIEQATTLKLQAKDKLRRDLMISLAVRAFELEKGARPTSISDLYPNYLKAIPIDPATGKDMTWKP
jgi:hypothetical protein